MILVDTSVMVDFLRGEQTAMTDALDDIKRLRLPFGFSAYTYMELLRGAKNEREFDLLQATLGTQRIYYLPESEERYRNIARMYFDLRRKGMTIRGTIDLLIVATAIKYDLLLLHDDRDFDYLAPHFPDLKIYETKGNAN